MKNHTLAGITLALLTQWSCDSRGYRAPPSPVDPGPTVPGPADPGPADPGPTAPDPADPFPTPSDPTAWIQIFPNAAVVGSADLSLTITGHGFADTEACESGTRSVVVWWAKGRRTPLQATFVSAERLTAVVPAALMTGAAMGYVFVETWVGEEDAPRSTTRYAYFMVGQRPPAISSISIVSVPAGSPGVVLTITGSGFENASPLVSNVCWAVGGYDSPAYLDTTFNDDKTLTAVVPAEYLREPITAWVFVETWNLDRWGGDGFAIRSKQVSFVVTP